MPAAVPVAALVLAPVPVPVPVVVAVPAALAMAPAAVVVTVAAVGSGAMVVMPVVVPAAVAAIVAAVVAVGAVAKVAAAAAVVAAFAAVAAAPVAAVAAAVVVVVVALAMVDGDGGGGGGGRCGGGSGGCGALGVDQGSGLGRTAKHVVVAVGRPPSQVGGAARRQDARRSDAVARRVVAFGVQERPGDPGRRRLNRGHRMLGKHRWDDPLRVGRPVDACCGERPRPLAPDGVRIRRSGPASHTTKPSLLRKCWLRGIKLGNGA